jgi:flagellar hook-associated protein 3 FlgL
MVVERITDLMTQQATTTNVTADLDQLTKTDNELSSGLAITEPSDNPYGASVVLDLNSQLSQLGSYSSNITNATSWMNTSSSALSSIENMVQTVRQLVVEGANGTNTAADDQSAAQEVDQLIDAIKQTANTTYDGSYIFSGTATSTAPYESGSDDSYQGNSGTITAAIGSGSTVPINTNIESILGNGNGSNGSDGLLLGTLRQIASDLNTGTGASQTTLGTTDLTALDNNLNSLDELQANVGALTDRLSIASSQIQSTQSADNTELVNTQDANKATLATDYSTESAGYQAALQAGAQIIQESLLNFLSQ